MMAPGILLLEFGLYKRILLNAMVENLWKSANNFVWTTDDSVICWMTYWSNQGAWMGRCWTSESRQ